MGDEGTFATTAEVGRKCGANASATSNAEEYINQYIKEAESYINTVCRFNYTDNYASLNADVKSLLKEAASNIAAIYVIMYDMSGFTSRTEAQTMLDVLWARTNDCIGLLREKQNQTFINGA
jgi:hypothetical protein